MKRSAKIIGFDCDGVLFDTRAANRAYYDRILTHFGKPPLTEEQFAYAHMHTVDNSILYLFEENELKDIQAYRKIMTYEPFFKEMKMEPFVKPLIEKMRPSYKTAIATNRSDTMDRVLTEFNLKEYFDLVVTALDVKQPKPYPDQLLKILHHFGAAPHELIYIGDSEVDEKAATAAGVIFVAYKNTSLSADFHINTLKELESIL